MLFEKIDLSNNRFEGLDFSFEGFDNLRVLIISNNYLTMLNQTTFEGLEILYELDVSLNKLIQIETNAFESLHNLVYLNS